jgi:putative transposase
VKYAFIRDNQYELPAQAMCRVFKINRSGYYAWLSKPSSARAIEDQRLLKPIKAFYVASGGTYGSPWIRRDLRDEGESCSLHRVAKIMRENKLKAQIGYKRRYIKSPARSLTIY